MSVLSSRTDGTNLVVSVFLLGETAEPRFRTVLGAPDSGLWDLGRALLVAPKPSSPHDSVTQDPGENMSSADPDFSMLRSRSVRVVRGGQRKGNPHPK